MSNAAVVIVLAIFALVLVASATVSSSNNVEDNASNMESFSVDAIESQQAGKAKKSAPKKKKGGRRMELAVQDEATLRSDNDLERITVWKRAKQLGATWVRQMFYIGEVHPCLPATWIADAQRKYTRFATEARKYKLKVHITFTGVAASWGAACGASTGNPDIAYYKQFIAQYFQFFYKLGVRRFSLWNEPNLASFLCAGTATSTSDVDKSTCTASANANAMKFLQLYREGSKVIRTLQKRNKWRKVQIILGEFAGHGGVRFLERLLKKTKLKADGFSWHPYQYCNPPSVKGGGKYIKGHCRRAMGGMGWLGEAQKALKKWAKSKRLTTPSGKRVPMYLTEFGYHRKAPAGKPKKPYGIPESYRAKWYKLALERARKAGVKGFVLYQFYPRPQEWDTSLLHSNGKYTKSFRGIHAWAKSRGYKVKKL